jgi:hypothetical protein
MVPAGETRKDGGLKVGEDVFNRLAVLWGLGGKLAHEFTGRGVGKHGKIANALEVIRDPVGVLVRCLTKFGRRHELEETKYVSS